MKYFNKIKQFVIFCIFFIVVGCGPRLEPLPQAKTYPDKTTAIAVLHNLGYEVVPVTGTGSMVPLIPAHPLGRQVIVAYAGIDKTPYSQLKSGYVVIYTLYGEKRIHRLGQQDERGFIAYGLNNADKDRDRYGNLGFVTPYNYIGKVVQVNLFPLNK